jgi:thiol-disulfide isomerase/thioredoxin
MNQNETESTNRVAGRKRRYLTYGLEAGLFIAVFFAVSAWQSRNLLGTDRVPAPSLSAVTLDGDRYDLATSSGKPVLVYFFAPWCAFCSASADNVDIIAVALDWQSRDEVREYASEHKLNVPVLLADAAAAKAWHVYAFPTYYVLDSEHRVVARDIGYSTQLGLWWRSLAH